MTPRQRDCLQAIREMTVDGIPPTYRQLAERLGLSAVSRVHRLVHGLAERGYISLHPARKQTIQLTRPVEDMPLDRMTDAVWKALNRPRAKWHIIREAMLDAAKAG